MKSEMTLPTHHDDQVRDPPRYQILNLSVNANHVIDPDSGKCSGVLSTRCECVGHEGLDPGLDHFLLHVEP